jgi:hypothetical protein
MNYRKETTDYGVTIYSAVQPDYDQELQVVISSTNLVCRVAMNPTPKEDNRTAITKQQYESALGSAREVFNQFLKM